MNEATVGKTPYSREGAAGRMGASLRTVDVILTGKLASIKLGRRRLVSEEAIQEFLRKHELGAKD